MDTVGNQPTFQRTLRTSLRPFRLAVLGHGLRRWWRSMRCRQGTCQEWWTLRRIRRGLARRWWVGVGWLGVGRDFCFCLMDFNGYINTQNWATKIGGVFVGLFINQTWFVSPNLHLLRFGVFGRVFWGFWSTKVMEVWMVKRCIFQSFSASGLGMFLPGAIFNGLRGEMFTLDMALGVVWKRGWKSHMVFCLRFCCFWGSKCVPKIPDNG